MSSIDHPSHPKHPLVFLRSPRSMNIICDACANRVTGPEYCCALCNYDVHEECASVNMLLNITSHKHPLSLRFDVPYATKTFNCDLCRLSGRKQWVYRCSACNYDAHLSCALPLNQQNALHLPIPTPKAENLSIKQSKKAEEALASKLEQVSEELLKAKLQNLELERQIAHSDRMVKQLEDKLAAAQLFSDRGELERDHDEAARAVVELPQRIDKEVAGSSRRPENFSNFCNFSLWEIEEATNNFATGNRIGGGGYGSVFRGILRNTPVAIKILNSQSFQSQAKFLQEVDVLGKVRHPNLVMLIGACPEAWALIYEFLPNGSLEDRLACRNDTLPLSWQTRTRIAAEISLALIFLHSNKPYGVVHGGLKPANILLDSNLVSKLSDFGIFQMIGQANPISTLSLKNSKGTFAYMDPEFLSTGELTTQSDVYSFGIIVLRLLTGKPAIRIVEEVKEALASGNLQGVLDESAGKWPFIQAKQLAHLGLNCCETNRKNRPDLESGVWRVLKPMSDASLGATSSSRLALNENSRIPSYFICPIFQEIMRDPHIAEDGYTYEAEALKAWFDSGHDTSPMTNLKLFHCSLIPNHPLRSAIQEWQRQS